MANNLTVTGNLAIGGSSVFTGTVDLAGGALNTDLVTNFNADLLDSAHKSIDGTLADNSDAKIPTEKAVKTYVDLRALDSAVVHDTGDETVAGVKTFSSAIVANLTGNVTGDVTGKAGEADGVVETGAGGATLKCKVIEIGVWNMYSTASVVKAHGLTVANIRSIAINVRSDDASLYHQAHYGGAAAELYFAYDATNITIARAGTLFYGTDYDSTVINRGWITIWYEA